MKDTARQWLENGTVDLFIGYRMVEGHPLPHCFTKDAMDELEDLVTGPARYPLEKFTAHIAARYPDAKIGLIARDCNQRALNVLSVWNQVKPENIKTAGVNCCPSPLKSHGDCSYLVPKEPGEGKKQLGFDNRMTPEEAQTRTPQNRLDRWMYEFQKCIKCYGCRNICPVCFCEACTLEDPDLVSGGNLPPDVPIFHLVRAVHMAGRCVDCGLCEDACPVDIPLRLLYRKVNEIVMSVFDYETGTSTDQPPFSVLGEKVTLEPKPLSAA